MQLKTARTNMKSRLVYKVKGAIKKLYEFDLNNLLKLNLRIDYLLEKNWYFCKYQDV